MQESPGYPTAFEAQSHTLKVTGSRMFEPLIHQFPTGPAATRRNGKGAAPVATREPRQAL